ncbi:hypothetical protein BOX15_Mlig004536g1, partial [Macrostomum lignano]
PQMLSQDSQYGTVNGAQGSSDAAIDRIVCDMPGTSHSSAARDDADAEPGPVPNMSFSYQVRTHRTPAPSRLDVIKAPLLKYGPSWLSHPEIQHHCRLILLSSFFCTFGVVLLIVGVYILSAPPHPNFSAIFIVGGVIIFIPGIYHLVYVLRAYHGHEGYSFQDLPIMD